MAAATEEKRREPYIGEKRKFVRDGYGTYVYENSFFRYEGEWMKGKKHGHGKLVMKDGTHYEGQFINGEINGNGYKYFASSQSKYTGQFLNGEMHGHGIMAYKNGNVYEGQWYKNKKQGFGILRTGEKSVYEGTFHGHVRDGEGTQTYDPTYVKLSNGDRFEGYWVLDKRQGHGELWCADGSHYSGQFMNDLFHGDGVMSHASGIVYRGNWVNGYPATMATKLGLVVEESPLIIRQGIPFAIRVECRNDEDEIIPDQGRELQVIAGFKYRAPKEGSALFDVIEDVEDKPIPTPFGYDVVPYPLTDQLSEVDVPVTAGDEMDSKMSTLVKTDDEAEDKNEEDGEEEVNEDNAAANETVAEETEATEAGVAALTVSDGDAEGAERSEAVSPVDQPDEAAGTGNKPEEVTPLLPPVPIKPSVNGICEWQGLQLAPPPPMYRPFAIMEEEAGPRKKSKLAQIRERMDEPEDEEDEDWSEGGGEEGEDEGEGKGEEEGEGEGKEEEEDKVEEDQKNNEIINAGVEGEDKDVHVLEEENADGERKNSQLPANAQKQALEAEKSTASDEKIARTGEYVLIVQDASSPPFMGVRLEPAYLLLKLKKPKRIIVKKPKWDTQRHIAMAMSRASLCDN